MNEVGFKRQNNAGSNVEYNLNTQTDIASTQRLTYMWVGSSCYIRLAQRYENNERDWDNAVATIKRNIKP